MVKEMGGVKFFDFLVSEAEKAPFFGWNFSYVTRTRTE